ncbi:MAG: Hsp20/alpha crystallin family protein [Pseudomonadota bacterium]
MLDTLKEAGKNLTREIGRTWDSMSEGWRELLSHGNQALTYFSGSKDEKKADGNSPAIFPSWSLLAGEVEETEKEIVVRMEVPGIDKENCNITIEGNTLYLKGEKRYERVTQDSTFHVTERAYGSFQRAIPLPSNVDPDQAEANYKNGVLTIRLPKVGGAQSRTIKVS